MFEARSWKDQDGLVHTVPFDYGVRSFRSSCGINTWVSDVTHETPTCLICVVVSKPMLRVSNGAPGTLSTSSPVKTATTQPPPVVSAASRPGSGAKARGSTRPRRSRV